MHALRTLGIILICGVISTGGVLYALLEANRADLEKRVGIMALGIDAAELQTLSGTPEDLSAQGYKDLKSQLAELRTTNRDARFIYVLGMNEAQEVFFYADSEDENSADYSPPGQVYYEATDVLKEAFRNSIPAFEGPERDRWGVWMTGYAPVFEGSELVGIIGIDVPAERELARSLFISLIPFFVCLVCIALVTWLSHRAPRYQDPYAQ